MGEVWEPHIIGERGTRKVAMDGKGRVDKRRGVWREREGMEIG